MAHNKHAQAYKGTRIILKSVLMSRFLMDNIAPKLPELINYSWAHLPIRLLGLGHVYRVWYSCSETLCIGFSSGIWLERKFPVIDMNLHSNRVPDEETIVSGEDHCRKWGNTAFRQSVQMFLRKSCSGQWPERSGVVSQYFTLTTLHDCVAIFA